MYGAEAGRVEVCKILLEGVENYDQDEEDRAVRKNRLDKLLDQALKAGCDVPLAKMVLGNCQNKPNFKKKFLFCYIITALRDIKAEFLMTLKASNNV